MIKKEELEKMYKDIIEEKREETEISKNNDYDSEDQNKDIYIKDPEYKNDINNYYDISNINEIVEQMSNGVSIDDACEIFGLSKKQKNIVILILARDYYVQERYSSGNKYLKMYEKSSNKTNFTNNLFNLIRRTKKFYKGRRDSNYQPLGLCYRMGKNVN